MKSNGFHPGSLLIQRKFINASVVSLGFSSSTQWPVFEDNDCGVRGDIFDLRPRTSPFTFSPPIASAGMGNLVCESSAKSFAVC
jgi:hypothetical protein